MDHILPEVWAVFEFFRRLGYKSDDLYLLSDPGGVIGWQLQHEGKQYTVTVLELGDVDGAQFQQAWGEYCSRIMNHQVPEEELQRAWEESAILRNSEGILLDMRQKGFNPPAMQHAGRRVPPWSMN